MSERWKIFSQGVTDIQSTDRIHRILTKDPMIRFGLLLLPSGEYISSG
jgi:hypothetical protein